MSNRWSDLPDRPGDALLEWLARTPEEAIDPEQPIIDPHHHLWDWRPRPELLEGIRIHLRYLGDELMDDVRSGGPIAKGPLAGERDGAVFVEWQRAVRSLADCPNVVMKLGGCGMPAYGWGYSERDAPPSSAEMAARPASTRSTSGVRKTPTPARRERDELPMG